MTTAGRLRQRRRPLLLAAVLLSTIWAAWWLWPRAAPQPPDFEIRLWGGTGARLVSGSLGVMALDPPIFRHGHFYAKDGQLVDARTIIRDQRRNNIDSPSYSAIFLLDEQGSRTDLEAAAEQIWAICAAAVYVPIKGRDEVIPLLPRSAGRDCSFLFDA
jgi:hypothetical protein